MPRIGGRVIFNPVVLPFVLDFKESVGLPLAPPPSLGLRVGFRPPDGGFVKPGFGAAGLGGAAGGGEGVLGAQALRPLVLVPVVLAYLEGRVVQLLPQWARE